MQEKNYKKFYFLDSKIHKPSQMLAKIENEKFAGVIFRKSQNFDENFTKNVLKICKSKKIIVFSFNKQIKHDVFYYGSNFEKKLSNQKCAFVLHNTKDLQIIAKIKPHYVLISPVFATKTHEEMKPLGVLMTFKMAKIITTILPNCKIILLGGMTNKRFFKIKKMDCKNLFYGFAGVRF